MRQTAEPTMQDALWAAAKAFLTAPPEPAPAPAAPPTPAGPTLAETFRHSGWMPDRKTIAQAMQTIDACTPRRRDAFACCGSDARVESRLIRNPIEKTEYRVISTKCHDRFCLPCSTERARRYRTILLKHMYPLKNLSLVTLTLKQSDDDLTTTLNRITRHFRRLRSSPLWKNAITGGAAIIETKIGTDGNRWNVHYHVVCEAKYLDQKKLAALWLKITGDSEVVDIRRVGAKIGAVQYITKYVTKAADHAVVKSPRHLSEALVAFIGRRLVSTFGTWRGLVLSEYPDEYNPKEEHAGPWTTLGPLDAVLRSAVAGDSAALAVIKYLQPAKFVRGP